MEIKQNWNFIQKCHIFYTLASGSVINLSYKSKHDEEIQFQYK